MKRQAKIIRYNESRDIALCVDLQNSKAILKYLNKNKQHIKKFNYIVEHIFRRLKNTDIYDKEEFSDKAKGVTAMKFFKRGSNDRIYCRELSIGNKLFVVIAVELLEKKKNKSLNKRQRQLIEKISNYEYQIIE